MERNLNMADHCSCWATAGKKSNSRRKPSVKFWLLTPTWNQVLRLAMLKTVLRKKNNNKNNSKPQQKSNHRLEQVADYQPGDRLKEGTQIFILLSVQQKVWKKSEAPHITKTARHCLCWCCFSQEFLICWLNRPTYTTSNTSTDKLDLAANCLTLHCQTWWLSLP